MISELERQKEQAHIGLSKKDEVINSLEMKLLNVQMTCRPIDAAVTHDEAEGKSAVLCHESTNLVESNIEQWDLAEWEESSPIQDQQGMTVELCGELCSILHQLRRCSFKKSLTKILLLPLTSSNIEAFAYIIHQMAINYPDLSEVFANLSVEMLHKLPHEIGTKMRNFLVELCDNMFMDPVDDPDNRAILRDLDKQKILESDNFVNK
jgi:hypothetical protein